MIAFLLTALLLCPLPDFRTTADRRTFDDERYTEFCVGLYQRPETWACVEVPRG